LEAFSGGLRRLEDSLNIEEHIPDSGVQRDSSQSLELGGFGGFLALVEESFSDLLFPFKHAIKCIYERLKPIRNRKLSVVNFLRNDIADLLRNGNAEHAFGRMDELINDMNRLACYDVIKKFCEDVMIQLPVLQKQSYREFPPEDREAMSTLIFAAARFSDLPELCDLREAFQARCGNDMEMSVNPEFKEKSATRAFSASRKLQLMKNIASEFSVNWKSEAFEYRITNPTASKCDLQKKTDAHQEIQDPKVLPVSEKDGLFKHVVTNAKGIHVIKRELEPTRQIKPWAEEPENMTPSAIESSNRHAKLEKDNYGNYGEDWRRKNDSHRVTSRAREVLDPINQDNKVVEQPRSRDEHRDRSKVPPDTSHDTSQPNGTDEEQWGNSDNNYKGTSTAQVMWKPDGEEGNIIEQAKLKDETRVRHVFPPVQQELDSIGAKESHDVVYKRSSRGKMDHREERKQAVGQQEFVEDDKPRKVPLFAQQKHMNYVIGSASRNKDFTHAKSRQARQEADIAPQDGRVVEPQKPNNDGSFHMIPPPYVKSSVSKVGANSEHAKSSSQPTDESVFAACEKSSSRPGHVGMSAISDKPNSGSYKDLLKDELVADDEKPKPRSVRRKQQKPPVAPEVDCTFHDDEPVPRTSHGQRRHSPRQNTFPAQGSYDEEGKVMDRLLMHYSKKSLPGQPSKSRLRTQALPPDYTRDVGEAGQYETNGRYQTHKLENVKVAHADHTITNCDANQQPYRRHRTPKAEAAQFLPADHLGQDGGSMLYQAYSRYRVHRPEAVHPPERTVSLPSDPATPKEMSKGPARATWMQPDLMSPHSQLPDHEELAARFAALKRL
ncbi:hypothetical protein Taro_050210, partial [Colocasia esculenta]|nr:hypothetical protein [Colocasia esculenta]